MIRCLGILLYVFMVSNQGTAKPDICYIVLIFSLQPYKHKHTHRNIRCRLLPCPPRHLRDINL